MPVCRLFEVHIARDIEGATFGWPVEPDADELEGNHYYQDLRFFDWPDVQVCLRLERRLIAAFEASTTEVEGVEALEDELEEATIQGQSEDPLFEPLCGLDLGVASATYALSAAGCLTFSSCNGGAFGGAHVAAYPLVAFFMPAAASSEILKCAEEAAIGLLPLGQGRFQLFSDDIHKLIAFAENMLRHC